MISSRCSSQNRSHDSTVSRARSVASFGVAGLDHLVGGGLVDRLLVHAAQVDDPLAELGVRGERRDGVVEELCGRPRRCPRRWAPRCRVASRAAASCWSGSSEADDRAGDLLEGAPAGQLLELLALVLPESAVEASEAGGDGGDGVGVAGAEGELAQELLERDGRLAVEGHGVDELALGDPDRVDDHEPVLGLGVRGDGLAGRVGSITRTPRPFICSK